jgi:hypothetical protein
MKNSLFCLLTILIATHCSSTTSQGDIVGEAYNTDDHQDVVAVTYGIASDGGNNLADT